MTEEYAVTRGYQEIMGRFARFEDACREAKRLASLDQQNSYLVQSGVTGPDQRGRCQGMVVHARYRYAPKVL